MFSRSGFQLLVFLASSVPFHDKLNWVTEAALTETPKNVVALISTRVVLKCSTNISHIPIDWYFTAKDNSPPLIPHQIYLNEVLTFVVNATYSVEVNNNGTYSLVIKSLSWREAGEYFCHDRASAGQRASANVTVLDPFPTGELYSKNSSVGDPTSCYLVDFKFRYLGDTVPTLLWNSGSRWNSTAANTSKTTISPAAAVPVDVSYKTITMDLCERYNCSDCLMFCYLGTGKSDEEDVFMDEVVLSNSTTVVSVVQCKKSKVKSLAEDEDSEFPFASLVTAVALLSIVVVALACCLCHQRKVIQDLQRNRSGRSFPLRYEFLRFREEAASMSSSSSAAANQIPERSSVASEPTNRRSQEPAYATLSLEDEPVDYRSAMKNPQQRAPRRLQM